MNFEKRQSYFKKYYQENKKYIIIYNENNDKIKADGNLKTVKNNQVELTIIL